jgi:hypothetical protein
MEEKRGLGVFAEGCRDYFQSEDSSQKLAAIEVYAARYRKYPKDINRVQSIFA